MNSHKVLIRSADRTSGSNSSYTIVLPTPLRNVVHAEWSFSSLTNVAVSIPQLGSTGLSTPKMLLGIHGEPLGTFSSPIQYWRIFPFHVNNAVRPFSPKLLNTPSVLYDLSITVTPLKNFYVPNHFFEIEFWTSE